MSQNESSHELTEYGQLNAIDDNTCLLQRVIDLLNHSVETLILLDSGADQCYVSLEIAAHLPMMMCE